MLSRKPLNYAVLSVLFLTPLLNNAQCPSPSASGPRSWVWNDVQYGYASAFSKAIADNAANSWNALQPNIRLVSVPTIDTDIAIYDDNSLPANIGAVTESYGQDFGTCYNLTDTCGKCMNSAVMYAANVRVNYNAIVNAAAAANIPADTLAQNVLSHELGHALRLADVPVASGQCSEVQSVMYGNASIGVSCGVTLPQPCDRNGLLAIYPVPVALYCPCSGQGCGF